MELWKRNLWILMACQFFVMGSMSMIIPFLPLYLQELGVSDPEKVSLWTGLIFGANFLTAFLFSPFWGRLADRYGRKSMVLRSGFGMAVVLTLTGFATGPLSLLGLRLLNGVISGFIPASIGLVATNTPKQKVGYALGMLQSGAVAGSICGPLLGGLMAEVMGYRMIFYVTGFFILIAAFVVLFFVKESFTPQKEQEKTNTIKDFKKATAYAPILSLYVVTFLIQFALIGVNPFISLYVQELSSYGNLALYAGLAVSVMGFANMLTSPILGKMSDKKGAERVLVFALIGVAVVSIPQAFVTSLWQLIILRFMVGLCLGGLLPAVNTLIRHHSPEGMEGRTYGFSNSALYLGNMLGPLVGGWTVSLVGLRGLFIVASVVLFTNVIIVKWKVLPAVEAKQYDTNKKVAAMK
ncbi:MFS transporter [Desertibacillus haloalkaliphilus]|uniref:MFS transporter n=1 Tax=Desertibacillus haloalkaliphilus TaxID=1328930 RepID=UPI001C257585|nr:MFS transporter [Desertibacillus haloalkaliphilus]MBU8907136.1 MFS transporter [Desertibacillus haloalkaliphilus]